MNNSHSFLTEQAFLIAIPATAVIKPLTFRACFGHAATHRIHEIHLLLSVILGFFLSIAPAGHLSAHKPQPEHSVLHSLLPSSVKFISPPSALVPIIGKFCFQLLMFIIFFIFFECLWVKIPWITKFSLFIEQG